MTERFLPDWVQIDPDAARHGPLMIKGPGHEDCIGARTVEPLTAREGRHAALVRYYPAIARPMPRQAKLDVVGVRA